jgi:hypothetical protein
MSLKKKKILKNLKSIEIFFLKYTGMGKMVRAGARAGAEIFDKMESEPYKNGLAPQHCLSCKITASKIPVPMRTQNYCNFQFCSKKFCVPVLSRYLPVPVYINVAT